MTQKTSQRSNQIPLMLIAGGVVIILALLVWQLSSQSPAAPATQSANANLPYASIQRVSLSDAKTALDKKTAVFVDVRDLDVYNSAHVTGAINIPLGDFDKRYRELDPNQWIITYCT
jgi:hypothetical protein